MTQEQSAQFDAFGCASRCLLWLANLRGEQKRTKEEFIDEFLPYYPEWATNCGGTNTGTMLDLAKRLKLATHLQVYRSPLLVKGHVDGGETNTILLITEKRPPVAGETGWKDSIHCRVMGRLSDKGWHAEEVNAALATCNPVTIRDDELEQWSAYFCVFFLAAAPSLIHGN